MVRAFFVGLRQSLLHMGPELQRGAPRRGDGDAPLPTEDMMGSHRHVPLMCAARRHVRARDRPAEADLLLVPDRRSFGVAAAASCRPRGPSRGGRTQEDAANRGVPLLREARMTSHGTGRAANSVPTISHVTIPPTRLTDTAGYRFYGSTPVPCRQNAQARVSNPHQLAIKSAIAPVMRFTEAMLTHSSKA